MSALEYDAAVAAASIYYKDIPRIISYAVVLLPMDMNYYWTCMDFFF